jgi:hypothetical protein
MGITDRLTRIARSYLRSTQDKVGEEWDELSQKWSDGELGEDLLNKLKKLRNQKSGGEDLSEEEVRRIFEENEDDFASSPKSRQSRTGAASVKHERAIDDAFKKFDLDRSASMAMVEKAFKREMLKFHPDRFPNEPQKLKSATKVSQMLSEAYNLIKADRG